MKIILMKIWGIWIDFIHRLNQLMVQALLALLFILVIIPHSFIRRLKKNKDISIKDDFVNRCHIYSKDDLKKLW